MRIEEVEEVKILLEEYKAQKNVTEIVSAIKRDVLFHKALQDYIKSSYQKIDPNNDYEIVCIDISDEARELITTYKNIKDGEIDVILESMESFFMQAEKGKKVQLYRILFQLIPVWIFLAINLATNEIPEGWTWNNLDKIQFYIEQAFHAIYKCELNDPPIAAKKTWLSLDELQEQFLLNEVENPAGKTLSTKDRGRAKYSKKYGKKPEVLEVTYTIDGEPTDVRVKNDEDYDPDAPLREQLEYRFRYTDTNQRRDIVRGYSVFCEILASCKVVRDESEYEPNHTINILVFNEITQFVNWVERPINNLKYTSLDVLLGPQKDDFDDKRGEEEAQFQAISDALKRRDDIQTECRERSIWQQDPLRGFLKKPVREPTPRKTRSMNSKICDG